MGFQYSMGPKGYCGPQCIMRKVTKEKYVIYMLYIFNWHDHCWSNCYQLKCHN